MADEFEIIARCFAPLATDPGARGLVDDAALLEAGPLVATVDAIVEGVHFMPTDPIETVARKALRVNLSDLAAKGATPFGYLLTLAWPRARPAAEIERFAAGLAADQAVYGLSLLGGDTVSTPGPLTVSITALGRPGASTPSRAGARVGDVVFVTGAIGDGHLGLLAARDGWRGPSDDAASLIDRYRLPQPRLALASAVATLAHAAMDVSDGLFTDAAKIAAASGVALEIDVDAVPVSDAAGRWLAAGGDRERLCAGGDDYEILLTLAPRNAERLRRASAEAAVPVTAIGVVAAGEGLWTTESTRGRRRPDRSGFTHRLGG